LPNHIRTVITTLDSKHVFVGLADGSLHQICIETRTVIKDYGVIHRNEIGTMVVTRDSDLLITGSYDLCARKFSIQNQEPIPDWRHDRIFFYRVATFRLTPDDQGLFVFDDNGDLELVDLVEGERIKLIGNIHSRCIG
jgi:WD40 repeat protein